MYDRDLDITIGYEPRPARPLLRFVPSVEYRRLTCGCLQERSGRVPYRTWRLTDQCRKHHALWWARQQDWRLAAQVVVAGSIGVALLWAVPMVMLLAADVAQAAALGMLGR